jgi:hypothetical protein
MCVPARIAAPLISFDPNIVLSVNQQYLVMFDNIVSLKKLGPNISLKTQIKL